MVAHPTFSFYTHGVLLIAFSEVHPLIFFQGNWSFSCETCGFLDFAKFIGSVKLQQKIIDWMACGHLCKCFD